MANPSRGGDAKPRGSRSQPGHRRAVLLGEGATAEIRESFTVRRLFGASAEAFIILILITGLLAIPVLGARGGGGGKPGPTAEGRMTLAMLADGDANANGLPNYMDSITFTIAQTSTDVPMVGLRCWQGSNFVQ